MPTLRDLNALVSAARASERFNDKLGRRLERIMALFAGEEGVSPSSAERLDEDTPLQKGSASQFHNLREFLRKEHQIVMK